MTGTDLTNVLEKLSQRPLSDMVPTYTCQLADDRWAAGWNFILEQVAKGLRVFLH